MTQKKKALIALKKAKTSIEKNIALIEQEENCEDIMIQNLSIIGLVKSANNQLISWFLERCQKEWSTDSHREKLLKLFTLSQK